LPEPLQTDSTEAREEAAATADAAEKWRLDDAEEDRDGVLTFQWLEGLFSSAKGDFQP